MYTYDVTKALLSRRLSLSDMARERKIQVDTVIDHLEKRSKALYDSAAINATT